MRKFIQILANVFLNHYKAIIIVTFGVGLLTAILFWNPFMFIAAFMGVFLYEVWHESRLYSIRNTLHSR